ncbi:MFS transporter [Bacillus sp. FJAT-47783]|uniref:MFS transporter n=1 Tax=Bacillus sp. FJAT-47783 TaxID=2922712 RepID=UPI001FAB4DAA|nr:MFS transporter [Bacillus sp. FJAT-47783]
MDIFNNRNFVKLFLAAFMSQMGSTIGNMAFAFYLLDHFSDQPYYATLAELMYSLPTIFVFFIVGVVADRLDRKKVAEWCDWIRACLTILLFFTLFTESLPLIFLILFLRSAVTKFFFPAESSLVQGILRKDQYATAAGLNQILFSLFMVFGVGLGALTYKWIGIHGAIVVDCVSFIVSALFIRACKIPRAVRLPNGLPTFKNFHFHSTFNDFKVGLKYILKNRLLSLIIFGFFVFGFFQGSFAILPMFTMKFELAPFQYETFAALFAIFLGAGLFVGSLFSAYLAKKCKPYYLFIIPILMTSIFILLLGVTDNVWFYLTLSSLIGICIGPVNIVIGGWMPKIVDPKFMGRVSGWIDPVMMFAQSLTLAVIAVLFPKFVPSVDFIYYGMAVILLGIFLFYAKFLPKKEDSSQMEDDKQLHA